MNRKIDERIPNTVGKGKLPSYPAVASPWGKLMSYVDAAHFSNRNVALISSSVMQAFRILIPDYEERSEILCTDAYNRMYYVMSSPIGQVASIENNSIHPFMKGSFTGALNGDSGDEANLMCGRVNDFGTYRAEKELDYCDWDIIGTELCRATTCSLQGVSNGSATLKKAGPELDYHMVESRGAGDLHCRIVAENREKFPMPEHKNWECFGPVATDDYIKFTPEEDMVTESQFFRKECNYKYCGGTCAEYDAAQWFRPDASGGGAAYISPTLDGLIKAGKLDEKTVAHVLHCVCEAAGKAAFGAFFAKEGFRQALGIPTDVNDGRLMGAYIELVLQCQAVPYEVEAFNKEEVIYSINRMSLGSRHARIVDAHVSTWYGMTKTLVNAQWSLWEEALEDTPDEMIRIKIAKKIDKYC